MKLLQRVIPKRFNYSRNWFTTWCCHPVSQSINWRGVASNDKLCSNFKLQLINARFGLGDFNSRMTQWMLRQRWWHEKLPFRTFTRSKFFQPCASNRANIANMKNECFAKRCRVRNLFPSPIMFLSLIVMSFMSGLSCELAHEWKWKIIRRKHSLEQIKWTMLD